MLRQKQRLISGVSEFPVSLIVLFTRKTTELLKGGSSPAVKSQVHLFVTQTLRRRQPGADGI